MGVYDIADEFEKRMAEYCGAPYGVAVNQRHIDYTEVCLYGD